MHLITGHERKIMPCTLLLVMTILITIMNLITGHGKIVTMNLNTGHGNVDGMNLILDMEF